MTRSYPDLDMLEAAAQWMRRREIGDLDANAFQAWLDADPRHVDALMDVEAVGNLVRTAGAAAPLPEPQSRRARPASARTAAPRRWHIAAAAACLTLVVGGGWWLSGNSTRTVINATDRPDVVPLSDGSTMTQDAGTTATIRFSRLGRTVDLAQGRAYFEVEHDGRPFRVRAGPVEIRATGTAFEVENRHGRLNVSLAEGGVEVARSGAHLADLKPGERLVLAENIPAAPVRVADLDQELSWRSGMIYFENTPLAEVIARVNDYSPKEVVVADAALGRMKITAGFKMGQTRAFISALESYYGLSVTEQADRITVRPRAGRKP